MHRCAIAILLATLAISFAASEERPATERTGAQANAWSDMRDSTERPDELQQTLRYVGQGTAQFSILLRCVCRKMSSGESLRPVNPLPERRHNQTDPLPPARCR